ncbi:CPBP family intramembrane metalloprotease [Aeoliella sp. ICT_H6.2]|uniref:CPBP family intramembrane metalloprotease n=1 Tax=Aeoliella straminimaris TaxID=2954799 RepID=A0A9X2JH01_9BACT|nr:type II CAAX endopeptidase family protein [Aeoliella straminimaris]MCO6044952.1 CPBP family intramembrane metalloprotease [Aeoliella straminimaris]
MHDDQGDLHELTANPYETPEQAFETAAPQRPRIWTTFVVPLVAIVLAVLLQIVVALAFAIAMISGGESPDNVANRIGEWIVSSAGFLAMLAAGQLGFALPTLLAAQLSPEPLRQRLGLVPLRNPLGLSVMMALGTLLPLAISFALVYLVSEVIPPDQTVAAFFEQLTPGWGIAFVVLIALAPGFIEEMLFRGYIQRRLLKRWSPFWSIATSSVLFGLAHVTPHAIALALPLGLWLGVIAWRTGSIIPTIVCHAFVNGGVNIWRLVIKFGELSETTQWIVNAAFLLIGAACFVIACRMLVGYSSAGESIAAEEKLSRSG